MTLSTSVREALALFGLFVLQIVLGATLPTSLQSAEPIILSVVYVVAAAVLFARRRHDLARLVRDGLRTPYSELAGGTPPSGEHAGRGSRPSEEESA